MDQIGRRKGQVINQSNGVDAIIYDRPDYVFWTGTLADSHHGSITTEYKLYMSK